MADSKYLNPPQPPLTFTSTPESILTGMKDALGQYESIIDSIAREVTPATATWDNVMEPILLAENERQTATDYLGFYQNVSTDEKVKDASSKAVQLQHASDIRNSLREDMFHLVDALHQARHSLTLEPEQLHILEKVHQDYVKNGIHIPAGPTKQRLESVRNRISTLSQQMNENATKRKSGCWLAPDDFDGVDPALLDVNSLEKGTGEHEGKVLLTFKYDHSPVFTKYAKSAEARKKVTLASANKGIDDKPIMEELFLLEDEKARLLGFDNAASLAIHGTMPESVADVRHFVTDLQGRLTPVTKGRLEELLAIKKQDCQERGIPYDGIIWNWDFSYYNTIMTTRHHQLDSSVISQYFPVGHAFDGMLRIFEEVFGFVFTELAEQDRARLSPTGNAEDLIWHQDVHVYTVFDEEALGGEFRGYLYRDLHPRELKFSHNASFMLGPSFRRPDGSMRYIDSALVCNFSRPTAEGKPGLLTHFEMWNMFHELGHCIHDLAARTRYAKFCGASTGSFNEAPSQMLENWAWEPPIVQALSKKWDTGEQIPLDMAEKLAQSRFANAGAMKIQQVFLSLWELASHTPQSREAALGIKPCQLFNKMNEEVTLIKGPSDELGWDWGCTPAGIPQLASGYGNMFQYLYTEVFAADMYQNFFKKNPMSKEQGRRYRKMIIGKGGSVDARVFLREYLGREPSSQAFLENIALVGTK